VDIPVLFYQNGYQAGGLLAVSLVRGGQGFQPVAGEGEVGVARLSGLVSVLTALCLLAVDQSLQAGKGVVTDLGTDLLRLLVTLLLNLRIDLSPSVCAGSGADGATVAPPGRLLGWIAAEYQRADHAADRAGNRTDRRAFPAALLACWPHAVKMVLSRTVCSRMINLSEGIILPVVTEWVGRARHVSRSVKTTGVCSSLDAAVCACVVFSSIHDVDISILHRIENTGAWRYTRARGWNSSWGLPCVLRVWPGNRRILGKFRIDNPHCRLVT